MLLTHQLPPELAKLDATDRENWVATAALAFTKHCPLWQLLEIVARGEDEFVRLATPGFHGQDFSQANLQDIFRIIKYEAQRQQTAARQVHG